MPFPYEEFDLSAVRTYPLSSRDSKVRVDDFARPVARGATFKTWLESLPTLLGADDLRRAANAIVAAKRRGAGIIWGVGAHVIKTGVSPVLIDLMQRGYVTALAMNGAGIIHDFEIALAGGTSEDVDAALGPGSFGMADETGRTLNEVVRRAAEDGLGFGQAVGTHLAAVNPPYADRSLAVAAHRLGVPLTVHVALGTDIVHMHVAASGAAIGDTSLRDFRYFTSTERDRSSIRPGTGAMATSEILAPRASLTPPTAFWTLPSTWSARPSAFSFSSPVTLPAASLTLPPMFLAAPSTRS